jgi:predicted CXXCH cytochrome family protein
MSMTPDVARSTALRVGLGSTLVLGTWLFLAAMPVMADGGPHVASASSGSTTLAADGCAGCHRAHTAVGEGLLNGTDGEQLCLTCHGAAGTGATTNVDDGVQYALANDGDGQPVAGALRSGGFVNARLDTTHPTRISYPKTYFGGYVTFFSSKVPELAAGQPVTSAHVAFPGTSVVSQGTAWGNGGLNTGPGPAFTTTCTSCHNPHGNGQYRILVPIPTEGSGLVAAPAVDVTDAALPSGAGALGVRNYTNIWGRTLSDVLLATYPGGGTVATGGDYWRDYLPWNGVPGWNGSGATPAPVGSVNGDRPMYVPGSSTNLTGFRGQITAWCSACHTRYDQTTGAYTDTGDSIFRYRHDIGQSECTQCHVAHGSNAGMPGDYSSAFPYPDDNPTGTRNVSASSRLLKIDNRGTCQACHDPTHTIGINNVVLP